MTQTIPDMSDTIAAAISGWPGPAQARFTELRQTVFETASRLPETGGLTETLKWGEPSYAPVKSRTGTAIRITWKSKSPDSISLFVNCQTSLIETWRDQFPALIYVGNREIRLSLDGPMPDEISSCIAHALTYRLR